VSDRLAVVYDHGAVSPGEIALGLGDLGEVVFLVPESPHTRTMRPVIERLGPLVPLTGDHDVDRIRPYRPAAILTFSEPALPATASLAAALGLPFHSAETTRLLTDKISQRARLRASGVDDVRGYPVRSPDDWPEARSRVGLPAILKPGHGQGSRHTHVLGDDESARELIARVLARSGEPYLLVEELLVGRESGPFGDYVSVESMCATDGVTHLAITGKLPLAAPFRETGRFWPARLTPAERSQVLDLATRALRALGVTTGLTHTEIKLTDDGPRVIEVNGRLGGHVNLLARQACGADLVRLAGQQALGGPRPEPLPTPDAVYFQHNTLTPTAPCRLTGVTGAAEIRKAKGINGFRLYARIGDSFPASVMTRHLDILWGRSEDHAGMIDCLNDALPQLSYDFQFED
jgi:biotin carboxylase